MTAYTPDVRAAALDPDVPPRKVTVRLSGKDDQLTAALVDSVRRGLIYPEVKVTLGTREFAAARITVMLPTDLTVRLIERAVRDTAAGAPRDERMWQT
jgi:hypothetical protein